MTRKPYELTIKEASKAIAEGRLTPTRLVESCLERIKEYDKSIIAWAQLDAEGALATADKLDKEAKRGKLRGPLHGIPIGIKDIIYVAGLRAEAGSKVMAGFMPDFDATIAARLKDAGAIILGKTHTTEFAYADPAPTHNPWNTNHTPGGSSSGSAAGVAARMCPGALGSQTLGSVLRPAAYNGIIGFKPSHGRISTYGVFPVSQILDHIGILARSVEDAAAIFQVIAGYDMNDYYSLNEPVPDCISALRRQRTPRLGLLKQYFYDNAEEDMRQATDDTARKLHDAGASVTETHSSLNFADVHSTARLIMAVDAATYHKDMYEKNKAIYRSNITGLIEDGLKTSAINYSWALQERRRYCAEIAPLFEEYDALLTPGAMGAAPHGLSSTGSPIMQAPWSIMGLPAINLPIGLNGIGLPLGIQLVGPSKQEDKLLAAARWCEKKLEVTLNPPLV